MNEAISVTTHKDAPVFNLKAVVMETGLKPPTIRAWERRYGLPQPTRTSGGHRQYTQHDIEMLKWLVARQEEGMSISHAVDLWRTLEAEGRNPLVEEEQPAPVEPATSATAYVEFGSEISELREAWLEACLAFERATAEQVLARAFALFSPEVVSIEILQSGLAEIGRLWYEGEISVQQEHFTSAMSVQRMEMLIAAAPAPIRSERIIVASAQDDFHVFGPLLLTFLLRRRGWDVLYLGADVPVAELEETVEQTEPQMLILSTQLLTTAAAVVEAAEALADHELSVAYGGLIFNMKPELQQRIPAHFLGPTIDGAVEVVEKLIRKHPPPPAIAKPDTAFEEALQQFRQRRSLIESHVWSTFAAAGKPTDHLPELNIEMAGIIEAALKFGDSGILSSDMKWADYLTTSFRLTDVEYEDFIAAYHQAARVHLGGASQLVVDWLQELADA